MTWQDEGDTRVLTNAYSYTGNEPVGTFSTTDGKSISIQGKTWGDIAIQASSMGLTSNDAVDSNVAERLTTQGGVVILEEDLTPLYTDYGAIMTYKGTPLKTVTYDQLYAEAGKPTPRDKVGVAVIPVEEIQRVMDDPSSPLDQGGAGLGAGSTADLKVLGFLTIGALAVLVVASAKK